MPPRKFALLFVTVAFGCGALRASPNATERRAPATVAEIDLAFDAGTSLAKTSPARQKEPFQSAIILSEACLPRRMRIPARVDLDDMVEERDGGTFTREHVARPEIRFLRPLCVGDPSAANCHEHPGTTQSNIGPTALAIHQEGVAIFEMTWVGHDLFATFEAFDPRVSVDEAKDLPRESLVVQDCCDYLTWSEDGVAELTHTHGRVRREGKNAPWLFEPFPPLCAIGHVPGDEKIVPAFEIKGAAARTIPATGITLGGITAVLRGPAPGSVTKGYSAEVSWVGDPFPRIRRIP